MENNIGKKIKQLRLEFGLTQPELAQKLGVSNAVISFWENNINEPKASYIRKISLLFNVTTDYLLGLENEDGTKVVDSEQKEYIPIVARTKDNTQRNLTISRSELKKLITEAIEYTNKNKDK